MKTVVVSCDIVIGNEVGKKGLAAGVRSGWQDLSDSNLDEVGDVPAAINYRDVLTPILISHSPGLNVAMVSNRDRWAKQPTTPSPR